MRVKLLSLLLVTCAASSGVFTGCRYQPLGGMQTLTTNQDAQLIHLRTDISPDEDDFRLGLNADGRVAEIHYVDSDKKVMSFDVAQLQSGIVLVRKNGMDVVTLLAKNFDAKSGGPVTLHYLFNGLTGEYRDFQMEIDRSGTDWTAYRVDSAGRRPFHQMFLRKNEKMFVGVVGILAIETD